MTFELSDPLLAAAFAALPAAAWILDMSGRYRHVSEAFARLVGRTIQQCIGRTMEDILPPSLARVSALRNKQLLESRSPKRFEQIWPVGGEARWFEFRIHCLMDTHNEPVGIAGYAQDVTEHMEQQEVARRIQAGLEKQVVQRTLQLSATNQELEAFSYSVSHDLQAPLHAIRGFAELLEERSAHLLDDAARSYLKQILDGADQMRSLTADLLELARVNQGGLLRGPVDLGSIARNVLDELAAEHPERTVDTLIAAPVRADCDGGLMRVALVNLIGNAWKFTSKTEHARIEFGTFLRSGRPVYFVRDNGAGFDMQNAVRMFGAFQRFHRKDDFPGTGIGLATVKRIIGRHGGQIWAESAEGQGATFYFTLDLPE